MYKFIKPLLFRISPERVHDATLFWGRIFSKLKLASLFGLWYDYKNEKLCQTIQDVMFENPVGLAAGFDKDASLIHFLPSFGFGFLEIGSITYGAYAGNKKPWLVRLPKDKSILVNFGLKSKGVSFVKKRLLQKTTVPIGVSIAATNRKYSSDKEMAQEFVKAYQEVRDVGNYYTINISCPNSFGGEGFCSATRLPLLLDAFARVHKKEKIMKPFFLKLKVDLSLQEVDTILSCTKKYAFITGFVIGNLTKDRKNLRTQNVPNVGGLSGKLCFEKALALIQHVHERNPKYVLIGVGGVFTAEDCCTMLKAGAHLVQLITGMIYQGPATVKHMNQGIVSLLAQEGHRTLSEAIRAWHTRKK